MLDDTTSALDPTTESIVLEQPARTAHGDLRAAVASRPSTIALADDVVYVAGGRVAAHGTHDELMRREPAYRQLVEAFESDRSDGMATVSAGSTESLGDGVFGDDVFGGPKRCPIGDPKFGDEVLS